MSQLPLDIKLSPAQLARISHETLTEAANKLERGEALNSFEVIVVTRLIRTSIEILDKQTKAKK